MNIITRWSWLELYFLF